MADRNPLRAFSRSVDPLELAASTAALGLLALVTIRSRGRVLPLAIASGAASLALGNALKMLVRRPRPDGLTGGGPKAYGFPSTHAAVAVALAGVAALGAPSRLTLPLHGFIALAVASRVRARRHDLADVVAGGLLGAGVATAGRALARAGSCMRRASACRPTAVSDPRRRYSILAFLPFLASTVVGRGGVATR